MKKKKYLRKYCEKTGQDLEIKIKQDKTIGGSFFTATLNLMIDDGMEEIEGKGDGETRKEAERNCALNICAKI